MMEQNISPTAKPGQTTGDMPKPASGYQIFLILIPVFIAVYIMTSVGQHLLTFFSKLFPMPTSASAFVAGTFFVFYGVERALKIECRRDAKGKIWQVPVAAGLGALPDVAVPLLW